jgi:hypothetical protein
MVYGLKKRGLVTFGKPKERRSCAQQCPDHPVLVSAISNLKEEQVEIKLVQKETNKTLGSIAVDVSFIRGQLSKEQ